MNNFLPYYKQALYFAKNLTRNPQQAEDIIQNVFLKLRDTKLTGEENYRTYLLMTVRSEFLNHIHRKKLNKNAGTNVLIEEAYEIADKENKPQALSDKTASALRLVDQRITMPLILFEVYDYGHNEIAKIMNIPSGTVKSRIFRAKEQLRDLLTA